MYTRTVEEAAARLRELRHEEWEQFGLAALALGLAIAASQVRPALALALFLGGLTLWAFGLRSLWRHWDLLDRLAEERDAQVIPEVLRYASRAARPERRRACAAVIRSRLSEPRFGCQAGVVAVAEELEALACELDDGELAIEPACAVACARLVSDATESPLLNPTLPAQELRSRVRQIRSGFRSRPLGA